jgi:hypothetical protein
MAKGGNRSSKETQKYPHKLKTVANGWLNDEGNKFVSYNPIPLKPTDANQEPPTPEEPLRRRYQQAGGC